VMLSHRNIVSNIAQVNGRNEISPSRTALAMTAIFTSKFNWCYWFTSRL
jgi:hypothetical protein